MDLTLLKKEVEVICGVGYYIVRVRCTFKLTGKEILIIEQLGSSSSSIMDAEKFAMQALEDKYLKK